MRRGTCFAFIMAKSFKTLLRVATRLQLICCVFACFCAFTAGNCSIAETGYDAWLRYPPVPVSRKRELYRELPETIVTLNTSPIAESAKHELIRGFRGMLASEVKPTTELGTRPAIILATTSARDGLLKVPKISKDDASLRPEEFHIQFKSIGGKR